MITFVYAQDLAGGIGYQNEMPWHLPNDLKFFKEVTMGHTIVMGRKTFEALNQRLLPGRKTIVVTRQTEYGKDIPGLTVIHSVDQVVDLATNSHILVIGGAELFKQLFPYADQVIRTVIEENFVTDVQMPELDLEEWEIIKTREGVVDDRNHYRHQYQWWQRKGAV